MPSTLTEIAPAVAEAVARHCHAPDRLLQILIDLQDRLDWLSPQTITEVATALGLPRTQVQGTASFYSFLSIHPAGHYRVLFADNIIEQMAGSRMLFERMIDRFGVRPGQVAGDGLVSIGLTSCIGLGDQGPSLLVNGRAIPRLTLDRVDDIIGLIAGRTPLDQWPDELFAIDSQVRRPGRLLGATGVVGDGLRAAIARGADGFLAEMEASMLRGRGGAGFTTALKWRATKAAPGGRKVVVCNADEGEPGTFKDRVLLSDHAPRVFEGMALSAYAIGADRGFLYLRGEYRNLLAPLNATLDHMRAAGLLGRSILGVEGFDFDIDIHLGAGAYVCGEETALIESLEGKPGKPRIRPPFPATHGYLGRPTAVNNVETLANAVAIAIAGGAAFRQEGTRASSGSKILSVSGDCDRPGLYEYAFGVTVREVLADCGAADPIAVVIGGASGVLITDRDFDRRIAFEDVPSAGAVMVFGRQRDMVDVAVNFAHFFAHESCGFCTPCRVGTALQANMLDKIAAGHGTRYEISEVKRLHHVLSTTSHCGLGQTASNVITEMLEQFKPAFHRRLKSLDYEPGFDLDRALTTARRISGRDDAAAHLEMDA